MFFYLFQGVKGLTQEAKNKFWQISSIFVYKNDKKLTFLAHEVHNYFLQMKNLH